MAETCRLISFFIHVHAYVLGRRSSCFWLDDINCFKLSKRLSFDTHFTALVFSFDFELWRFPMALLSIQQRQLLCKHNRVRLVLIPFTVAHSSYLSVVRYVYSVVWIFFILLVLVCFQIVYVFVKVYLFRFFYFCLMTLRFHHLEKLRVSILKRLHAVFLLINH